VRRGTRAVRERDYVQPDDEQMGRLRFAVFRILIVAAFIVIAGRLWDLQIASSAEYQRSADRNRFRLVQIDAPRGIIYDRHGRMLVRNVPSFAVSIVSAGLPEDEEARAVVLARLGELLQMPATAAESASDSGAPGLRGLSGLSIEQILESRTTGRYAVSPYTPIRIASNVDRQAAFIIEEEHLELPGVIVTAEPLRHYVDGPLTAHLLGYVGPIPSERVQAYVADDVYDPNDLVGLTGVELTQEAYLRGTKGQKHIEVDVYQREVAALASQSPIQGDSIYLTVDLDLQRAVEDALREGMRKANSAVGVAVAMDPRTGEVLAMVSLPSYNNNLFSGGISYEDYARLSQDKRRPLVNHAISGLYPPGSTFKIVPACAVLEEHVVELNTRLLCQGTFLLPNKFYPDDMSQAQKFYCWRTQGHGALNVQEAIQHSCDIFFYRATGGYRELTGLGNERLAEYATMFGFGRPTGIELSGEASGLVPTDRWKRQTYGENWGTGDTYNAAIGQGFVLVTPLQMLNATAAVANGGTLYRPQLVYKVVDAEGQPIRVLEPEVLGELEISEQHLAVVRQGMRDAVTKGTAWLLNIPTVPVAGKTGSAEYPAVDEEGNLLMDEHGYLPTHAWFAAFAPFDDPEIALIVFLEGGGEGSQTAVPVAATILRHYFGLPQPTPVPTRASAGG